MPSVLLRTEETQKQSHEGRRPCDNGRQWLMYLQAKKHQRFWVKQAGKSKQRPSSIGFRGSRALLTSWFWNSSLQIWETINFGDVKPPSLWHFVTAALENSSSTEMLVWGGYMINKINPQLLEAWSPADSGRMLPFPYQAIKLFRKNN